MMYTPCVGYCDEETDRTKISSWNCHNGDYTVKYNFRAIFSEEFISLKRFGNDTLLSFDWSKLFPRGSHAHILKNMRGTTNGFSYKNYRV